MAERKLKLTANVVVRKDEGEIVVLREGEVVPDWAVDQLGDHLTSGISTPATDDEVDAADDDAPGVPVESAPASEGGQVVDNGEVDDDETEEEVEPYAEWNKADLKAEAKGRQLSGYSDLSKEELVSLLEEDDLTNEEA